MTQKILLISGRKQSGKSSAMNYLAGYLLVQSGLTINNEKTTMFQLDEEGKLELDSYFLNTETGEKQGEWSRLEIDSYVEGAERCIWPIIKPASFAELIKEICAVAFALKIEELNGTDEQKNRPTHIKWENMYKLLPHLKPNKKKAELGLVEQRGEFVTNREFMMYFGTDVCRALYNECWIQATFTRVLADGYPFVVIPDCRYKDEVEYARQVNGGDVEVKVVRLTRKPFESDHTSETDLDGYEGFDAVIENEELTQEEKGEKLLEILKSWGWIV